MAGSSAAGAEAPTPQLDELMMAMDVVDTLRHEEAMVARELGQDDRDAALKARLRDLYEAQGLVVTERILDEGIAALRGSRFAYVPPPPSWRVSLARLWVSRRRWGPWAGAAAGLVILWLGWSAVAPGEADRAGAALAAAAGMAEAVAGTDPARAEVARLVATGRSALAAGRAAEAAAAAEALGRLADELALEYELRIVSRPGERTGVFRVPDLNPSAQNRYILVEAVAPGGRVLARPVPSEETGATRTVTIWGVRVPETTWNRIVADKQDDGIVQDAVLAVKRRGALEPDWRMPVAGGAITEWAE